MIPLTALEPRVYVSGVDLPDRDFTGYGFEGTDFIVGLDGLELFEASRGISFSGHDDGCYMLVERQGKAHTIAADPNGLCKLFVYRHGSNWAIANSFSVLVDRVSTLGWNITPDFAVLDAWTLPPNTFGACFSTQTVVREIALLNPLEQIRIEGTDVKIETRSLQTLNALGPTYEDKIQYYLRQWCSRILTLAQSEHINLNVELTGGLDSRTVFAFILHLRDRGAIALLENVTVFCGGASTSDLDIAQSVSADFNIPLSKGPTEATHQRSGADRFAIWQRFSLGMYVPPYFPAKTLDPSTVTLGGHGGERHRLVQNKSSLSEFLDEYAQWFRRPDRQRRMQELNKQDRLGPPAHPTVSPDLGLYRRNWMRFHHAHFAQSTMRTPPLMAIGLDKCLSALDPADQNSGFVLYDLMQRLAPGLARHPFDKPHKTPSGDILARCGPLFDGPVEQGTVFGGIEFSLDGSTPHDDEAPHIYMIKAYAKARSNLHSGGLRKSVVAQADEAIREIEHTGILPSRIGFQPIHAVMLSGLITKGQSSWRTEGIEHVRDGISRLSRVPAAVRARLRRR